MKLSEFNEEKYGGGGKNDFFNLAQGDNKVRIVSEFAPRYSHFLMGKYLGTCNQTEDCEFCNQGNKASVKFLCHIIDRTDNQIKLAQFGIMILKQLKQFSLDAQYQFDITPNWDCNIKRTGEKLETEYTVVPDRNDLALTNEEKEAIEKLKSPLEIVIAMDNKTNKVEAPVQAEKSDDISVDDIPF